MIFEDKFVGRPVKIGKSAKHYTKVSARLRALEGRRRRFEA